MPSFFLKLRYIILLFVAIIPSDKSFGQTEVISSDGILQVTIKELDIPLATESARILWCHIDNNQLFVIGYDYPILTLYTLILGDDSVTDPVALELRTPPLRTPLLVAIDSGVLYLWDGREQEVLGYNMQSGVAHSALSINASLAGIVVNDDMVVAYIRDINDSAYIHVVNRDSGYVMHELGSAPEAHHILMRWSSAGNMDIDRDSGQVYFISPAAPELSILDLQRGIVSMYPISLSNFSVAHPSDDILESPDGLRDYLIANPMMKDVYVTNEYIILFVEQGMSDYTSGRSYHRPNALILIDARSNFEIQYEIDTAMIDLPRFENLLLCKGGRDSMFLVKSLVTAETVSHILKRINFVVE